MILTCPSIGNAAMAARLLFKETGVNFIYPESSEGAEECDAYRDSPEDICLPFKLFMVQLEKAWEKGADTVIMPSSAGPCRLGEFCELLAILLKKRGCDYKWVVLDVPADIGVMTLWKRFRSVFPDSLKLKKLVSCMKKTYGILKELDFLEARAENMAGYLKDSRECSYMIHQLRKELEVAGGFAEAEEILGHFRWKFSQLEMDYSKKPVNILITGEIFSQTEPYASRRIEERLCDMGACVYKDTSLSWWVKYTAGGKFLQRLEERFSDGRELLPYNIGGYTRRTVASAASSRQMGYDGVIQIMPSGCMPEIVGHTVIDRLAEERNIRAMTLVFDEMSGDAGYITRIEAFMDMLERRRS